jgi:hypothetical protein
MTAEYSAATPTPANQTCETAKDLGSGGHWVGDFVDVGDVKKSECAIAGQPDLFYKFTLLEPRDVEVSVVSNETGALSVELSRGGCALPPPTSTAPPATTPMDMDPPMSTAERCEMGPRVLSYFHQLDAGEYTLLLEGPSSREISFSLDVALLPPTPAPSGDNCKAAQPITIGQTLRVALAGMQNDVASSCESGGPDAVFSFTLDAPQDVEVDADAEDALTVVAVQASCGAKTSERVCRSAAPLRMRMHDVPAGQYFVVLDSAMATSVDLRVDVFPPTATIPVADNDTCYSAVEIPLSGGVFQGDTRKLAHDYVATCGGGALSPDAAFKLTLPTRKHVVASVDALFDSVLLRYDSPAPGEALCARPDPQCDDPVDGDGTKARFDERLEAGTYYYVVDGYSSLNSGEYLFDVTITEP